MHQHRQRSMPQNNTPAESDRNHYQRRGTKKPIAKCHPISNKSVNIPVEEEIGVAIANQKEHAN